MNPRHYRKEFGTGGYAGIGALVANKTNHFKGPRCSGRHLLFGKFHLLERQADIARHGQPGKKGKILKDHRYSRTNPLEVFIVKPDGATRGLEQPSDESKGCSCRNRRDLSGQICVLAPFQLEALREASRFLANLD